jgi:phosphomannomutase
MTTELAPELYLRWGRVLGEQLEPGAKFLVGGDVRMSTPPFVGALIEGLSQTGVDVVDLGTLPTPIIYYAKHRLLADACAIVTASHNPPDYNGLKWMLGDRPPTQQQVDLLRDGAQQDPPPSGRRSRPPRTIDITFDYVAWLQELWAQRVPVHLRIVLDPMHGCWARRARRYLQAVFPHTFVSAIHDTPDAVFDGRCPDSSRSELLDELCEAVYQERADLGIAFDGDGDRITFVDNEGATLTAEETTVLLLESFGDSVKGRPFVYDLKFSDHVPAIARKLGAQPLVERSGHAFLRTRMLDSEAIFGAEISGHFFYQDLQGGDDGLFTACRMIDYLARSGSALSELRRRCPDVFVTPDLRIAVAADKQQEVLQQVRTAWASHPQIAVDGVRINFPDGWALVRGSVTEAALTFRFEASSAQKLTELVWKFCDPLAELGDALWARYEEAMGTG